jgi:hypothetical protein
MVLRKIVQRLILLLVVFYTACYLCIPASDAFALKPTQVSVNHGAIDNQTILYQLSVLKSHPKVGKRTIPHKHFPTVKKVYSTIKESNNNFSLISLHSNSILLQHFVSGCYVEIITPPPSIV